MFEAGGPVREPARGLDHHVAAVLPPFPLADALARDHDLAAVDDQAVLEGADLGAEVRARSRI
jgi:hypothetical protein